ncbi:hypothetical protein NLG97_g9611 [Lecanicillium saksenae]|uniref:Uncharacterized protein n=1 Tax=Lecanicillium saksenae TaxID=468837 RepID=A0ACC1QGU5_9HYPO|nr:hypothetical protein NLG97_g9611 [Lecanicillium saksenae]
MNSKLLAELWKIDATVHENDNRVEETRLFSEYKRNIRRQERKEVWHRVKQLGCGGFGTVHLEVNRENQRLRAVKKIKIDTSFGHKDYPAELNTLLEFSQPRSKEQDLFVEFFGWFQHGSYLFLAMEYVEKLDLETYVATRTGKVSEIGAGLITKQILQGLEFMHRGKFAHRDLKPANVMVVRGAPQWWVKLADFGLSKKLGKSEVFMSNGGTPPYMAPERCYSSGPGSSSRGCTYAVDLWATGCIAYRLVVGVVPFPTDEAFPTEGALFKFCRDESHFPLKPLTESNVGDSCISFIKALLTISPIERPSAVDALGHAWITSVASTDYPTSELQDPDIQWNSDIDSFLDIPPSVDTAAKSPTKLLPAAPRQTEPVVEEPEGDEGGASGHADGSAAAQRRGESRHASRNAAAQ